ncbi:Ebp2-domain-containing protein [Meredithblackwellia eburnea MCA 4105]
MSKAILKKAQKQSKSAAGAGPSLAKASSSKKKVEENPLEDESSDSEDDEDFDSEDQDEEDSEDGEDDEEEDSDEEPDVTPEAMARMMELLGDVDPAELGLIDDEDEDPSDSEGEEDESDEEEEDEDVDIDEEELLAGVGSDDDEMVSAEEGEEGEEEIELSELENEGEEGDSDADIVPVEKPTVNDQVALERVLNSFKSKTNFFDTLSLTYPQELNVPNADDDLSRELEFYKQALWGVTQAETLFNKASLPFHRPADYFAEMVKSDSHMSRIRQKLLDETAGIKASEDARKLREAKKFGKKVQVERLKEREKEKKEVGKRLESLKKKRKSDGSAFTSTDDFDVALEDAINGSGPSKKRKVVESERGGRGGKRGISRRGRDAKYGNPKTSRRPKENNDKLDGDAFGGGAKRGGGGRGGFRGGRGGGRGGMRGKSQRLGKSRRK